MVRGLQQAVGPGAGREEDVVACQQVEHSSGQNDEKTRKTARNVGVHIEEAKCDCCASWRACLAQQLVCGVVSGDGTTLLQMAPSS